MPSADFFVQPCATEIVTARNTESTKPRISDRSAQATRPIPPLSTMTAQRRPRREFSPQPPKAMEHFPACRGCQTFDYEIFEASKISHANSLISWCDDDNIHHRSAFATGCLIATLGPPVPRSGKKSPPPARFASNAGPVRSTRTGPRNRCDFSDTRCRRHFTNFRSRQHTGIDIDIFGEAAPKMRHFFKSEVAAVIDRRLTAVGMLGKMSATIAFAARHERWITGSAPGPS